MEKYKKHLISFLLSSGLLISTVAEAGNCEPWVAMAISVQGNADLRVVKDEKPTWQSINLGDTFCTKDVLRVRENSRVALLLNNDTVVRLDQNTTITFSSLSPDKDSTLDLKEGIAHFISRVKQAFKVITPFVNAAIEGTEFVVKVEPEQAEVTVFEGIVRAENDKGQLRLTQGQTAVALKDQAPVLKTLVKPRDAAQWALYYPTVLRESDINPKLPDEVRDKLAQSMMLNARGKATDSLNVVDGLPNDLADASVYAYRASLRLAVGRIDKAKQDIEQALSIKADDSNALALKSIVAIVQNQHKEALALAKQAVESDDSNVSAYLALSYAYQSVFDLDAARQAIREAPESAMTSSRRAELALMQGDFNRGLEHANEAISRNPDSSHTRAMLGFTHLIRVDTDKARKAFEQAIELEQTNPLAHLGLGLALIRDGELQQGRREIEYAASLDPNNSLIRSYLGKAYYEEGRNKVAADQFDMAKALDPNDPTPWFYDAIRKETLNDAVGALTDLENSIDRNDNRIVYRSRLMLDQDNASRGANVGKVYSKLGFEQPAIQEAAKSLTNDPLNHAAHRFMADMYLSLPRHEIATTSEVLQAQLMQPINTTPANQRLSYGNLGTVAESGALNLGYNEYSSLFEHNRNNINLSNLTGGNETKYYDINYFGVYDNISISASIFDYQSDGYRINNDQDQRLNNAFIQYALTPNLTFHFEFSERESRTGDIIQRFGENNFDPNLREEFDAISERVGFRYKASPQHNVLFSHLESERDFLQTTNDGFFFDEFQSGAEGSSSELQYIFSSTNYDVIMGAGHSSQDANSSFYTDFGMGPLAVFDDKFDIRHKNIYIHTPIRFSKSHILIIGFSYDSIEKLTIDKDETNPKIGYIYNGRDDLTLRVAAFETLKRPIISDQTLEPTQIAGFNQFFDEVDGTKSTRYGLGIDKKINQSIYFGLELTKRDLDFDLFNTNNTYRVEETLHRGYLSWLVNSYLSLNADFIYEDSDSEFILGFGDPKEPLLYTTKSSPISIKFFNNTGSFASITATYVEQDVSFENGVTMQLDESSDTFTIVDLILGTEVTDYPSLNNLQIVFGIKNIFDEDFNFHNTNTYTAAPRPLSYYPERYSFAKLLFSF